MIALLTLPYMVVDIAVDVLVEGARLDGEQRRAVASAEDELVAALALETLITDDPVRALLQPDGVELVDIRWAPRPADIGAHVPVVIDGIVRGEAAGEVAIELEVVVVGIVAEARIAIDAHHAEVVAHPEGTLQGAELCLVQHVPAHGEGGEVRHEGGLLRPWVVEVGLVGACRPYVGGHAPAVPACVPA